MVVFLAFIKRSHFKATMYERAKFEVYAKCIF